MIIAQNELCPSARNQRAQRPRATGDNVSLNREVVYIPARCAKLDRKTLRLLIIRRIDYCDAGASRQTGASLVSRCNSNGCWTWD